MAIPKGTLRTSNNAKLEKLFPVRLHHKIKHTLYFVQLIMTSVHSGGILC